MNKKKFQVFSPAKINLFLHIGKKRKDHFHTISSLMFPLKTTGDILTFKPILSPNINVSLTLSKKIQTPLFKKLIPSSKNNLVWKAAHLFYKTTHLKPAIAIHIEKNIPFGAGLGGGSSNAAATLLTLNRLYKYPLSLKKLHALSTQLGSDVSFFLYQKSAFVSGKGDKIKLTLLKLKHWILLLNPRFTISTPWAYQRWDELTSSLETPAFRPSLTKKSRNAKNYWKNDFEKVVFPAYPILEKAKEILLKAGAHTARLTGSGSSLYGVFKSFKSAQKAAKEFKHWIYWIERGP
ncbi:MAG: 4-(cytidine 5'-diphospho)-2-C-methyl-D-erythritol kinase [Deltaproteobacteria bacterium GWA2_38_16]|nr:MAG: 4-(cytidine 5'-diphospho)-2-C-methyl-D-erythritol kinase [Deltaproteobacteria bacterium GWA2_38_16]OGQ02865.1 MAG: 4-(cytidine 5'-diphospho)-2-C-methyl-D-erythritol kinase [Deltaproteobacteria bacterium RIFCSPHIGHO2_02_FULL_38_15]OGQ35116.1 MAG: 4-(cytidine 5'-diphospho)-2-C-methyl-D-erythritol kinase [Deltaproteobacteria bacterium RIFCSPLOWO2_01_FULL_38_9]OGQ61682.1 MAG: 4-(cytidine 5'-diphospho)-2-C-methyl-D-erythritol kinase [Deltaproteobacteria bacterium RIFCSPLOWO2_12_FULL_38_8]